MSKLAALAAFLCCYFSIIVWHWWAVLALVVSSAIVCAAYSVAIEAQREPRLRPTFDLARDRAPLRPLTVDTPPPPPPAPKLTPLLTPSPQMRIEDAGTNIGHCVGCGAPISVAYPGGSGAIAVPPGHTILFELDDFTAFTCPTSDSTTGVRHTPQARSERPERSAPVVDAGPADFDG